MREDCGQTERERRSEEEEEGYFQQLTNGLLTVRLVPDFHYNDVKYPIIIIMPRSHVSLMCPFLFHFFHYSFHSIFHFVTRTRPESRFSLLLFFPGL